MYIGVVLLVLSARHELLTIPFGPSIADIQQKSWLVPKSVQLSIAARRRLGEILLRTWSTIGCSKLQRFVIGEGTGSL